MIQKNSSSVKPILVKIIWSWVSKLGWPWISTTFYILPAVSLDWRLQKWKSSAERQTYLWHISILLSLTGFSELYCCLAVAFSSSVNIKYNNTEYSSVVGSACHWIPTNPLGPVNILILFSICPGWAGLQGRWPNPLHDTPQTHNRLPTNRYIHIVAKSHSWYSPHS